MMKLLALKTETGDLIRKVQDLVKTSPSPKIRVGVTFTNSISDDIEFANKIDQEYQLLNLIELVEKRMNKLGGIGNLDLEETSGRMLKRFLDRKKDLYLYKEELVLNKKLNDKFLSTLISLLSNKELLDLFSQCIMIRMNKQQISMKDAGVVIELVLPDGRNQIVANQIISLLGSKAKLNNKMRARKDEESDYILVKP